MFLLRPIFGFIGKYWDVISTSFGWVWTIGGGVMTAWATWAAGIFAQNAPFSWVIAGLCGAFVSASIFWLSARAYQMLVQARWTRTFSSPGDGVNPLDDNFVRKRIRLADFVSPAHGIIEGKTFDRCELIGPAILVPSEANSFVGGGMFDCNFICCKDNMNVYNVIVVKNCSLLNCKFYRMTFLVPESSYQSVPLSPWLTRTPEEWGLPIPWKKRVDDPDPNPKEKENYPFDIGSPKW